MKKWSFVLSLYITGILTFLFYSIGLLFLSYSYLKFLIGKVGKSYNGPNITIFIFLVFATIILLPIGNILLYKYFKKTDYPEISKGIIWGLFISIVGLVIKYIQEKRSEDIQYMNAYRNQVYYGESLILEREKSLSDWEKGDSMEYAKSDSLKRANDSINDKAVWEQKLPKIKLPNN